MKVYVALLQAFALVALAAPTLGDDATSPRACTVTLDEGEAMYEKMARTALRCNLAPISTAVLEIGDVTTLEARKTLVKEFYCDRRQRIRECLAEVAQSSEVCLSETRHKFLLLFRDLLENVSESACVQDGAVVATMFMSYFVEDIPSYENDAFHECMNTALFRIALLMDKDVDPHMRFFILYRELVISKECVGKIDVGDVTLMKLLESILGDVINKMRCMHPLEETAVLCKAIDVNLPGVPQICPIKTLDEEKRLTQDKLLEGLSSRCLKTSFLDEKGLNTIDTLERSWKFFIHNCQRKEDVGKCLNEVVTLSSVCLDESQHKTITLANDVLQHAMDSLCNVDEGRSVGYVMYKVLTDKDATPRRNAVTECVSVARRQQHEGSESHVVDAAHFSTLHRELKAFKRCLVEKLHGDNRAVFGAHVLLSLVERHVKCLDPAHGTVVPCESIDDTSPTTTTPPIQCPFVGKHENEPPTYEFMTDMAMSCLRSTTVKLAGLKSFTTPEQYRTFFVTFCHRRRDVSRCIDDMHSYSGVCLNRTNHQMSTTITDFFGDLLESGCGNDGEIFATVLNGLRVDAENGNTTDLWETCGDATGDRAKIRDADVVDTVAKTSAFHYGLLVSFKDCILKGASEAGTFKPVFDALTEGLLRRFKCIHPDDGTLVPCDTIVGNST